MSCHAVIFSWVVNYIHEKAASLRYINRREMTDSATSPTLLDVKYDGKDRVRALMTYAHPVTCVRSSYTINIIK